MVAHTKLRTSHFIIIEDNAQGAILCLGSTDILQVRKTTDNYNITVEDYNIMYIPTLVFIEDGKEVDRTVGVVEKSEISKIVNKIKKN